MSDIGDLCARQIKSLRTYFHEKTLSPLHQAVQDADDNYTALDLSHRGTTDPSTDTDYIKAKLYQWASKALHGRFVHELNQPHIDREVSNGWLSQGDIFAETEGFMLAIQDQVIATRNYLKYITKTEVEDDRCRRCLQCSETIQHITGGCQMLASSDYTERHNDVAKIVHQELGHKLRLLDVSDDPYWQYKPKSVHENSNYQLYWDRSVLTDRTVPHNRPDIVLVDKGKRVTWLMDIGVPNTHNILGYFKEKENKYVRLSEEIRQIWQQQDVRVIPLIISATGVVPKSLLEGLKKLDLPTSLVFKLQKAVILRTTAIVRRHLNLH